MCSLYACRHHLTPAEWGSSPNMGTVWFNLVFTALLCRVQGMSSWIPNTSIPEYLICPWYILGPRLELQTVRGNAVGYWYNTARYAWSTVLRRWNVREDFRNVCNPFSSCIDYRNMWRRVAPLTHIEGVWNALQGINILIGDCETIEEYNFYIFLRKLFLTNNFNV